jgi:hypothetical protein
MTVTSEQMIAALHEVEGYVADASFKRLPIEIAAPLVSASFGNALIKIVIDGCQSDKAHGQADAG